MLQLSTFKQIIMKSGIETLLTRNQRGLLAVFGAFLLQLCAGSYNGTFGNLLPYFTSYMRQVDSETLNFTICNCLTGLW